MNPQQRNPAQLTEPVGWSLGPSRTVDKPTLLSPHEDLSLAKEDRKRLQWGPIERGESKGKKCRPVAQTYYVKVQSRLLKVVDVILL